MVRASHLSSEGCGLDPRLGFRNCLSESWAWQTSNYHPWTSSSSHIQNVSLKDINARLTISSIFTNNVRVKTIIDFHFSEVHRCSLKFPCKHEVSSHYINLNGPFVRVFFNGVSYKLWSKSRGPLCLFATLPKMNGPLTIVSSFWYTFFSHYLCICTLFSFLHTVGYSYCGTRGLQSIRVQVSVISNWV